MSVPIIPFDAAAYLETEDDVGEFLAQASVGDDAEHLQHCLDIAARAKDRIEVVTQTSAARTSLHKHEK